MTRESCQMSELDNFVNKYTVEERRAFFLGKELSKAYAKYHIPCSSELIDEIISYLKEKRPGERLRKALDVGCGTGISTRILSPNFEDVYGIDVSQTQIQEAKDHPDNRFLPNLYYQVGLAEDLPFEDESIDLITAAISFHWFDREAFMKEVLRVLVPNGVLAICAPGVRQFVSDDSERQRQFREVIDEAMAKTGLNLSNEAVIEGAQSMTFPELNSIKRIVIPIKAETKLLDLIETVRSVSSFIQFVGEDPKKAEATIQEYTQRLLNISGSALPAEHCIIPTEHVNTCVMARKEEALHDFITNKHN